MMVVKVPAGFTNIAPTPDYIRYVWEDHEDWEPVQVCDWETGGVYCVYPRQNYGDLPR